MKSKTKTVVKQVRTRYSAEFKQQALVRAAQNGVAMARSVPGAFHFRTFGFAYNNRFWPVEFHHSPMTLLHPHSCGVTVYALESGVLRAVLLAHVRGCGAPTS
jgi:hypothetical protein